MKYAKGATRRPKLPMTKVSAFFPTLWMKDVDAQARRDGGNRSSALKTIVGDWWLKKGRAVK